MDHFSKAIEHATRDGQSVRTWVQPTRESADSAIPAAPPENGIVARPVTVNARHFKQNRILWGERIEEQAVADKYRMLRTQLLQRMRVSGWRRLAVTSPGPKAGKTLTSINLAISIARDGDQRVVLIDADLRKPSISLELGLDTTVGLIDHLATGVPLEELAVAPEDIANLTIVPGRRVDPSEVRPELLNSKRMAALLDRISRSSEPTIVIVDLPPVFVGDDVILVAEHMDCVLLIVEEGSTDVEELKTAAELLEDFNLIGTVLNKSTERRREMTGYYHAASKARD